RFLSFRAEDRAPRSEARSRRRPRPWLWRSAIGALLLALPVGGFALHRTGLDAQLVDLVATKTLALSADAGLPVPAVVVQGRGRASAAGILAAVGATRGTPILAVSPGAAKARLEAMPWVRSAAVERVLPDLIYVTITERAPLALWQRNGKLELVDGDGQVLPV